MMKTSVQRKPQSSSRRNFLREASLSGAGVVTFAGLLSGTSLALAGGKGEGKAWPDLDQALGPMEAAVERFMWLPRKEGRLLNALVRLARAKNVLQVGGSVGFASLWLAAALAETRGKLTTIEILPERVELARKHLVAVGLGQRVTCLTGNAHKVVPTLKGAFDFVLLDADKTGHVDYFQKLHPAKLAEHALILANNAAQPGEGMKAYLQLLMAHPEYDSVVVSATLEDGYCLSVRNP
ncbi:MAG: class I SAM-dependent methyltransferase [Verrucomicrobiota bacterium]